MNATEQEESQQKLQFIWLHFAPHKKIELHWKHATFFWGWKIATDFISNEINDRKKMKNNNENQPEINNRTMWQNIIFQCWLPTGTPGADLSVKKRSNNRASINFWTKLFRIYKTLSFKRFASKFIRSLRATNTRREFILHDFVLEWKTMDMSNAMRISNSTLTTTEQLDLFYSFSSAQNSDKFSRPKLFEVIGSFGQESFHQKR